MATKIEDLLVERELLLVHIAELESSIRSLELNIERKQDSKVILNEIQESLKESPDVDKLKKLVQLSSLVARIKFHSLVEVHVDNIISVTYGNGFSDEVKFSFQLEVEKPFRIKSILLTFEDDELQRELKSWRKGLCKKKDFQSLMNGIAHHASLISRMNSLLEWLTQSFGSNLQVESKNLIGCFVTSRKKDKDNYCILAVHWKIQWLKYDKLMTDSFILDISNEDLFAKKTLENWSKFSFEKHYSEGQIKRFWMEINDELQSSEAI